MIDESTSIMRHHLLFNDYQDILLMDVLPKDKTISNEIEFQLESIFNEIDSNSQDVNERLINFSEIINQYGHSIHPYVASCDISKLISLLEFPDLQETLLSILWSCSFLSPDIVGYFLEADSFIQKIVDIFYTDISFDSKLTIIKLLIECLPQFDQITSTLIDANFFESLISYCEESNDFVIVSSILLSHCKISEQFVNSAFPILQFIANNSTDSYSISRVLYIFSKLNNEDNDPEGIINQYIVSEYMERLDDFLNNEAEIVLINAIVTMLNSIIITCDIDTINFVYSCGIINSVIEWLFHVDDLNPDGIENNNLSILILTFLNNLLENSNSNESLLSSFFDIIFQHDFIEYCRVSSFFLYERTVILILDTILSFLEGPQTQKLLSTEFMEILIQLFESTEYYYQAEICDKLHSILLFYQEDTEFCDQIISMWMQNDSCAVFCPDLMAEELLIPGP